MFEGARRLKYALKSDPENEIDPASPVRETEVVLPEPLSQSTETPETELNGVLPLLCSSDFTRERSHVSVPAGLGLSGWYKCSRVEESVDINIMTFAMSATSSLFSHAVPL